VAAELGVRAPSLYAHVDGLDGLRRGLALDGAAAMAAAFREAAAAAPGSMPSPPWPTPTARSPPDIRGGTPPHSARCALVRTTPCTKRWLPSSSR
jgi:hypothetical protein